MTKIAAASGRAAALAETPVTAPGRRSGREARAGRPGRSPWLGIAVIALGAFGAEMAVSARYGYVRDELYFLAAGHHLAFGYVDQPPVTPLLARLSAAATGNTLAGLRLLPALCLAILVVIGAAMSRQAGAGRTGQLLAALGTATCAEYLGAMHELTTTTPDLVFWAVTLLLAMRLLASRDPRWWLAIGCCVGIASEAKWNIAFLAAALAAGLLGTGARELLRSRFLAAGCLIAAALAAPDVLWQAGHGWPALEVFRSLQGAAWHNRAVYWPAQVLYTGPVLCPVWIAGLVSALRGRFRPVALACLITIAAQFLLGGKPYYAGGAFTFLLAAGSVPVERWLSRRRWPLPVERWLSRRPRLAPEHWLSGRLRLASRLSPAAVLAAAMLAGGAVAAPVALSALPARTLRAVPLQKINYDLAESIGWPRLASLVARVYHGLPARQRRRTVILTGNYGEAGALGRYGPGVGLPQAYSGANNFWLWGPPPAAGTSAIAVNVSPALLRREFARVRLAAAFWNGLGVSDDEQGVQIFVVAGLKSPWARAWPAFRDYS